VRRQPFVLVISGPSGAGKTTFVQRLIERFPDLRFSVSATTRPQRPGETNGREYHFLSAAQFESRVAAGEFLEHADVHGARYGTLRSEVIPVLAAGRYPLLDVDVQGGLRVKRQMPDAVLVFLLPPSMQELQARLRARRTETEEKVQKRLQRAPDEIRCLGDYDYVVVNSTREQTEADLEAIVQAERLRRTRLTDDAGGPDVVAEYLRESTRPLSP
jgi:guanylate kinase